MSIGVASDEFLSEFIFGMLEEGGFGRDAGRKDAMLKELKEKIDDGILEALPDEKLVELDEILDAEEVDDRKIDRILFGSGLKFEEIIKNEMLKYRENFLG